MRATLGWLKQNNVLEGRAVIVVGNKSDLVRSREVSGREGLDLAVEYRVKFTETSAGQVRSRSTEGLDLFIVSGLGHRVDELLVGICIQTRFVYKANFANKSQQTFQTKFLQAFKHCKTSASQAECCVSDLGEIS